MKEKVITVCMYILLVMAACAAGIYWLMMFAFDDIVRHYKGGILLFVFLLIILAGIILPILKYRKYKRKWVLPMVLCLTMLLTPVFNNGILKFVEDDLRIYSKEKWDENELLRIYMLEDLETNYLHRKQTQEDVKKLLGEPDFVFGDNGQYFEYNAGVGFMETIMFYVRFENGHVAETGKLNH